MADGRRFPKRVNILPCAALSGRFFPSRHALPNLADTRTDPRLAMAARFPNLAGRTAFVDAGRLPRPPRLPLPRPRPHRQFCRTEYGTAGGNTGIPFCRFRRIPPRFGRRTRAIPPHFGCLFPPKQRQPPAAALFCPHLPGQIYRKLMNLNGPDTFSAATD